MKRTAKQPPRSPAPEPVRPCGGARRSLKVLIIALIAWLLLFVLVLLEHAREWARLLPLTAVCIVVYGAFVTRKIIKEYKH